MKHWLQTIGAMTLRLDCRRYRRKRMRLRETNREPAAPAAVSAEASPLPRSEAVVIDYNDAEIQSVLRTVGHQGGREFDHGRRSRRQGHGASRSVTYEDAMHLVVESKGFAFVNKNVVRIKSKDAVDNEPLEVPRPTLNSSKARRFAKILEPDAHPRGKFRWIHGAAP